MAKSPPSSPTSQALLSLTSSSSPLASSARLHLSNEGGNLCSSEQLNGKELTGGIATDDALTGPSSSAILPNVLINLEGKDASQLTVRSLPSSPKKSFKPHGDVKLAPATTNFAQLRCAVMKMTNAREGVNHALPIRGKSSDTQSPSTSQVTMHKLSGKSSIATAVSSHGELSPKWKKKDHGSS